MHIHSSGSYYAAALAASLVTLIAPGHAESTPETFDYIIIGGGTAGLAVATRLSLALPSSQILVLEAGPAAFDDENVYIPGKKALALGGPLDWGFTTTPQEHAGSRILGQSRGKVLGGSSAINLLSHDRAAAVEYDDWEATLGNKGWNWENMLDAMLKAENFTGVNSEHYGSEGVGDSGPVKSVINRHIPPHQEYWIPTANNLGIRTNLESLGGDVNGVMYQPSSIDPDNGGGWVRSYSANAYLPLAGPNLHVRTSTVVAKVNLVNPPSRGGLLKATGVTLSDGTIIPATREVILSAGTLQTPALLELSGIGNSSILERAGVKQLIDLPSVGENLQDHTRVQLSFQLREGITSFDILRYNESFAAEQLALYHAGEEGMYDYTGSAYLFSNWTQVLPLSSSKRLLSLAEKAASKLSTPASETKLKWMTKDGTVPQLEIIFSDGYTGVKGYPTPDNPLYGKNFFTLICSAMHPFAEGTVHINSSNVVHDPPLIDPRYLSHEHDLEILLEIAKFARKLASTEPLRSLWVSEYEPGQEEVQSDEEWRNYIRNTVLSIFHPVGTAAMGSRKKGGVVDEELRVYGTGNLRVVDASVLPFLISAHIATAVYGVAERAAGMIIRDAAGGGE